MSKLLIHILHLIKTALEKPLENVNSNLKKNKLVQMIY